MNHIYCSIWSESLGTWIAVCENSKRRGKRSASVCHKLLATGLLLCSSSGWALPSGEQVVAGQVNVARPNAGQMQINQSSQQAIVNWQGFSINANESVNIQQPNASATLLNRVVGMDASVIQGQLNANGQVYLVNPNGVLFSKTAQVDVGGLVATTHNLSNADFLNGNFHFTQNNANGTISNQGFIKTPEGSVVALIGTQVSNEGTIETPKGSTILAAGKTVDMDLKGDGLVEVKVPEAVLNAQINNKGAILADGGRVVLTAQAAGQLTETVLNSEGLIQAKSLVDRNGEIILDGGNSGVVQVNGKLDVSGNNSGGTIKVLADMENGTVSVGGVLDASAPNSGNGGFIETSAAHVSVADSAKVSTLAANGATGNWVIDPIDFTITAGNAPQTVSGMGADVLSASLANSNVTISTDTSTTGNGDIFVNAAISKTSGIDTILTLNAYRNIDVNANIGSTSGKLNMVFNADTANSGTGAINLGNVTLDTKGGTINAAAETVNINPGATTNLKSPLNVAKLNIVNSTLNSNSATTVSNALFLNDGTLAGTGTTVVNLGGTLTMSGGVLDAQTLTLNSTATGSTWTGGTTRFSNNPTFNNQGTFALQGNGQFGWGNNGVFNNFGTLIRDTTGTGTAEIYSAFNNTGAVHLLNTGSLSLLNGGNSSGDFTEAAGTTLTFGNYSGGTTNLTGTISGSGNIAFERAKFVLNGSYSLSGDMTVATYSTVDFKANSITTPNLTVSSGSRLIDTGSITVKNVLNLNDGTLAGAGSTVVNSGGTLTINGGGLDTQTLTLSSGATGEWTDGTVRFANNPTFNNQGTFTLKANDYFGWGNNGVFNNFGTLIRDTTGTGTAEIYSTFNNTGVVNLNTGSLSLLNGGNSSGDFTEAAGTTLTFGNYSGGTTNLTSAAKITGLGNIAFSHATFVLDGYYSLPGDMTVTDNSIVDFKNNDINTPNLTISNWSNLVNNKTVTVNKSLNLINSGFLSGTGSTIVNSGGTLTINGGILDAQTLTLSSGATGQWTGGTFYFANNPTFNNQGSFTLLANDHFGWCCNDGIFNNSANLIVDVGTGGIAEINSSFNSTGIINLKSGSLSLPFNISSSNFLSNVLNASKDSTFNLLTSNIDNIPLGAIVAAQKFGLGENHSNHSSNNPTIYDASNSFDPESRGMNALFGESNGQLIHPTLTVQNSAGRVQSLQMSANKQFLSLLLEDGSVRVWDFQTGVQRQINTQGQQLLTDISGVDDKGELVSVAGKKGIGAYDMIGASANLIIDKNDANHFASSSDGKLLFLNTGTNGLSLWDTKQNNQLWQSSYQRGEVTNLALSSNQRYGAVLGYQQGAYMLSADLELKPLIDAVDIVDLTSGKILKSLPNLGDPIIHIRFKDNDTLELGLASGQIVDWSIAAQTPKIVADFAEAITAVDVANDTYAYILNDGTVQVGNGQGQVQLSVKNKENPFQKALLLEEGKKLLAIMANGDMSVWDVASAKKMLRLFSTRDGWIVMDAFGRFDGSEEALDHFSWSANDENIPLDNFSENYYEPGLLTNVLQNQDYLNGSLNAVMAGFTLPPKLNLQLANQQVQGDKVKLEVDIYDRGGGINKIQVFHNGKALDNDSVISNQKIQEENDGEHRTFTLNISPSAGKNTIQVAASNEMGIENNSAELSFDGKSKAYVSDIKLFTVGINEYSDKRLNLSYSVADAASIAQVMKNHAKIANSKNLYDQHATKTKILAELKELSQGAQKDVLVIYFAGHGMVLGKEWYFLPHETKLQGSREKLVESGITATELGEIFKKSKIQHILLMVDSCYSGAGMDTFTQLENRQRYVTRQLSRSLGITVITAAARDQQAAELKSLGHGLFTYLVTQELQKQNGKEPVTAHNIKEKIEKELPAFSRKMVGITQEPAAYTHGNDFLLIDAIKKTAKTTPPLK